MKLLKFFLVAGGAVLTVFGIHETLVSRIWKDAPQEITCETLGRQGPGSNAHVRLVACHLGIERVHRDEGTDGHRTQVWLPAFPASEVEAETFDPTAFRVLVRTDHVHTAADLEHLAQQTSIEGLVVNEIETVPAPVMQRLEDRYPHTQIDRCWIIDHERKPLSTVASEVLVLGGLLLIGLGAWLYVRGRRQRADLLDAARRLSAS